MSYDPILLSGDVTGSGVDTITTTLASVNSNVGSFTNTNLTVDAKGRITAASSSSGNILAVRVVIAAGAITVNASTDYVIVVNKTTGAATTVNLPSSPATGLSFIIKDGKGDANTNNITLTPAAGNIDNSTTYVMTTNLSSKTIVYNGTQWNVI